jgi:hypothetical protein
LTYTLICAHHAHVRCIGVQLKPERIKQMKFLKEKYKTWEGASKRCGFENSLARSEFERGYKARLYRYTVEQDGELYRVARHKVQP